MAEAAFIYSESLASFDYGDDHPFKPMRARNTMELCNRHGLLYAIGVIRPEPRRATRDELELFHDPAYLDILARANLGSHDLAMLEAGIGTSDCPVLKGIYDFCLETVGATLTGVETVLAGEAKCAFNLVGGLHHAGRDHAEGFCYVNDVGIAAAYCLAKGLRVAYVDIDAHHGNGVQDAFYDSDQVLVISLHESGEGFYPQTGFETEIGEGKGRGYTVNVPLLKRTDDEIYLHAFKRVVPPLLDAFKPDVVIAEIGADTMISDPLTNLRLTNNGYEEVVKLLVAQSPKLFAAGGGGYDIYRTSRCWTLAFAAMCGIEPEDEYAGLVGGMMYGSEIGGLRDTPVQTKGEDKTNAREQADRVVAALHQSVFPILGARVP